MTRQRRNGEEYHVLGGVQGSWLGQKAIGEITRRGQEFIVPVESHAKADETAAMSVGAGICSWSIVTDRNRLPVSYAQWHEGMVIVTAAERYGVFEMQMFDAVCKYGACTPRLRAAREEALARGQHSRAESSYIDELTVTWMLGVRSGKIPMRTAHVGFYGPTFEYAEGPDGWALEDPVSLGNMDVLLVSSIVASIFTLSYPRSRDDYYLSVVSKDIFKQAWHTMMGIT